MNRTLLFYRSSLYANAAIAMRYRHNSGTRELLRPLNVGADEQDFHSLAHTHAETLQYWNRRPKYGHLTRRKPANRGLRTIVRG